MTPLLPMHSLGHSSSPRRSRRRARYHGMARLVVSGGGRGPFKPMADPPAECYEAALMFARTEGIIIAPRRRPPTRSRRHRRGPGGEGGGKGEGDNVQLSPGTGLWTSTATTPTAGKAHQYCLHQEMVDRPTRGTGRPAQGPPPTRPASGSGNSGAEPYPRPKPCI